MYAKKLFCETNNIILRGASGGWRLPRLSRGSRIISYIHLSPPESCAGFTLALCWPQAQPGQVTSITEHQHKAEECHGISHHKANGKNWIHEKGRPGGDRPRGQGRTEFMRTGVPEVIVLEARAAFGTPGDIVVILKMSVNVADSYKLKIGLV